MDWWQQIEGRPVVESGPAGFPCAGLPEAPTTHGAIWLLTPEAEAEARLDRNTLELYCQELGEAVEAYFESRSDGTGFDLMTRWELAPASRSVCIATQPEVADEILEDLYLHLERVAPPAVRGGPVRFQILYAVRGGAARPLP